MEQFQVKIKVLDLQLGGGCLKNTVQESKSHGDGEIKGLFWLNTSFQALGIITEPVEGRIVNSGARTISK